MSFWVLENIERLHIKVPGRSKHAKNGIIIGNNLIIGFKNVKCSREFYWENGLKARLWGFRVTKK